MYCIKQKKRKEEKYLMDKKLKGQRVTTYMEQCPLPVNMLVEVTNACNHACIFCAHSKMTRKIGMMDMDLYKKVAGQAYEGGTREIGFYMTGEPLMNNRLKKYVSYAKALGFEYIYMTTNGVYADLELMKELIMAGLNSIKFSIPINSAYSLCFCFKFSLFLFFMFFPPTKYLSFF